jgi:hypothetical protein
MVISKNVYKNDESGIRDFIFIVKDLHTQLAEMPAMCNTH